MDRDGSIITAIRQKDMGVIESLFFSKDLVAVNSMFKTETELWDYKLKCPTINSPTLEWAEISKDILAFHNTGKGGVIIFGVDDKDYEIIGIPKNELIDSKIFNDKIRKYISDKLWIDFYTLSNRDKSKNVGVIIIPPLNDNSAIKRFQKNGPEKHRKLLFLINGSAIRRYDSSIVLSPSEANELVLSRPIVKYKEYEVDEPCYRLLSTDYHEFILRNKYCEEVMRGLHHSRATSVCLIGIGGVGKTALATWAVKKVYVGEEYDYIVSISAKDRELTASGIQSISQKLTSLNDLLDAILDVIGFPETKNCILQDKRKAVIDLISGEKVLLFVDNLETAIDKDIIDFINNLPEPVKAIVTSRRNVITVSSYPVEIGPLENEEIVRYITSLASLPKFSYCNSLSAPEKEQIGVTFNGIPLAIKWMLSSCNNSEELLSKSKLMESGGMQNEELLEFSFRRVFDDMSQTEKSVMQVLAVISDLPIEAIIQGSGLNSKSSEVVDALESLVADTIIIRYYDPDSRSDKYRLLTLTQRFMVKNCITPSEEQAIHHRLSSWYSASDVQNPEERQLISAMRQGGQNMGSTLVAFAEAAAKKGDTPTAVKFFDSAMSRDPNNWKVYWRYGEYFRHIEKSKSQTITMYESALKYSEKEKMTSEIAIMNREFGFIYGNSGRPDAITRAIHHFEIAYTNMPNDPICAKGLATMYEKRGITSEVVRVLEPFRSSKDSKTRQLLLPILLRAYESQPEKYMIQLAELKQVMRAY